VAPYPKHLESVETTRDGTVVALRPVRPEDEPLLQDLFAHMSREDVRLRFFAAMRELSHPLAERFTHLDYECEMAVLAEHGGETLGVARYFACPDRRTAEFAVAVRSDWKGHGIGYVLMHRLIDVARSAGIGEMVGDVLTENKPMLAMCRDFGFVRTRSPGNATAVRMRKKLTG